MSTTERPTVWGDIPVELQREVFSHIPFWFLQPIRGVNKLWCTVVDSINPDLLDEQSRRCRTFCKPYITEFFNQRVLSLLSPTTRFPTLQDWKGRLNAYPPVKIMDEDENDIASATRFLKWYAKPHSCYTHNGPVTACVSKDEIIFTPACKCCKSCWKNTGSDQCPGYSCSACCALEDCGRHRGKRRERPCSSCKANDSATGCRHKRCGKCCKCHQHRTYRKFR